MPHSFFRLIHRARSRAQRRRCYGIILCVVLIIFFVVFTDLPETIVFNGQQITGEQVFSLNAPDINRLPQKVEDFQAKIGMRAPDMKLLGANSNSDNVEKMEVDEASIDGSHNDLLPDLVPATIHVIWCGRDRIFEYRHYLSIKRAIQVIKPDKIIFHYEARPKTDFEQYYTWFDSLLTEHDHIVLRSLNTSRCDLTGPHRYMLALSILEQFGGIFLPEDAILVDFPVHLRASAFISGVQAKTLTEYLDGVLIAKKGGFVAPSSQSGLNIILASGRSVIQGLIDPCGSAEHFSDESDGHCLCVKVEKEIFPKDIWENSSNFGVLARLAAYGQKDIDSHTLKKTTIPKIGHYICWDCDIKFNTFVSIMSTLHVAGLSKVYIHGLKRPNGQWWSKLVATGRVIHVLREYPEHTANAAMTQELAQGIMRVNILLKYGGVYCDNKVIWTSAIPEEFFRYDAVASPDWHQYGKWPDSISHTTIMAKSNSEYLLKLRFYHHQHHKNFWFIDQFLAYKIKEQYPDFLKLDSHLQVKCLNRHCHPTWLPDYLIPFNENPPGGDFNWKTEAHSVYWDVFPELELDTVRYTSGPIVDVARFALQKAGVPVQELNDR